MTYPSGTVTFLFTDIEGSTKLTQEYPDKWESLRGSNKDIAENLVIRSNAVSNHIDNIFSELQAADRHPRDADQGWIGMPLSRVDDFKYPSDMIGFNAICVQYVGPFL